MAAALRDPPRRRRRRRSLPTQPPLYRKHLRAPAATSARPRHAAAPGTAPSAGRRTRFRRRRGRSRRASPAGWARGVDGACAAPGGRGRARPWRPPPDVPCQPCGRHGQGEAAPLEPVPGTGIVGPSSRCELSRAVPGGRRGPGRLGPRSAGSPPGGGGRRGLAATAGAAGPGGAGRGRPRSPWQRAAGA